MKVSKSLVLLLVIIPQMALSPIAVLAVESNRSQSSLLIKPQIKETSKSSMVSKPVQEITPVQKNEITKASTPSVPVVRRKQVHVEGAAKSATPSQSAAKRKQVQAKKIADFFSHDTRTVNAIPKSKHNNLGGESSASRPTVNSDLTKKNFIHSTIWKQAETADPFRETVAVGKLDNSRKNLPQADDPSKIFEELDSNRRKNLAHADDTSQIIEEFEGDSSGLEAAGWHSTKDEMEGLANGLIDEKPGNPLGSGSNDLQDGLAEAEDALGKGSGELISGINSDYNEYWADVVAGIQGVGGVNKGSGGTNENQYFVVEDPETGKMYDLSILADGTTITRSFDKNGELTGYTIKGADGEIEDELQFDDPDPTPDSNGGTQASDGSDGEVNEGNVVTSGKKGPTPIEVKDPNEKESGMKIVQTDSGVVMVVDYEQLRDGAKTGPEEGMRIGTNLLTNEAINVTPGEVDPKAKFGEYLRQEALQRVTNPTR